LLRPVGPLAVFLVCALAVSAARAGCPNVCELTVEPAEVDPALACLVVEASDQTCDCSVLLEISNQCDASLAFPEGTFYYCGDRAEGCDTLPAGSSSTAERRVTGEGPGDWVLTFEGEGTPHTLTVRYHVSSFDSSPGGCALAAVGRRSLPGSAWFGVALALGLGWRRLRRRG